MNDEASDLDFPLRRQVPFAVSCLLWLGIGIAACLAYSRAHAGAGRVAGLRSLLLLWAIAVLDLLSLGRLFFLLAREVTRPAQNRWDRFFPASYWGLTKLACVGLFLTILYRSRGADSAVALGIALGLGTLVFVPLVGGVADFLLQKETRQKLA